MHQGLLDPRFHLGYQLKLLSDENAEMGDFVIDALVDFLPAQMQEGVAIVVKNL
jgi:hypothetical protein